LIKSIVTIGVIAAEAGEGLQRTLASVRNQSYGALEIVVLSPQEPDVPDIIWIPSEPSEPITARYDRLRAFAQKDYLLVLDDRSIICPDTVAKSVAYLENHPKHVAVYGATVFETANGTEKCLPVSIQAGEPDKRVEVLFRNLNHIGPWYGLRRRIAGDFPMMTSVGAEVYYLAGLAWSGGIGALADIECRVSAEPGFHLTQEDVGRLGCPVYQAEDPVLSAIALVFCGLGVIDTRYSQLNMIERLRIATAAEEALRLNIDIYDEVLLIPYCLRIFSTYNIIKELRNMRIKISIYILSSDDVYANNYIINIVNCLCRFRLGTLRPDGQDKPVVEHLEKLLADNPNKGELNRATLVSAMYY
jgi:hypothetical protein